MAEDEACKAIFWSPNFNSTPPPTPRKSWEVKVSQQRRPLKIPVALLVRGPFLRIFMRRHVGSQNQKRDSWAPYWLVVILNELGHCGSRDCNVHKKEMAIQSRFRSRESPQRGSLRTNDPRSVFSPDLALDFMAAATYLIKNGPLIKLL